MAALLEGACAECWEAAALTVVGVLQWEEGVPACPEGAGVPRGLPQGAQTWEVGASWEVEAPLGEVPPAEGEGLPCASVEEGSLASTAEGVPVR